MIVTYMIHDTIIGFQFLKRFYKSQLHDAYIEKYNQK